MVYTEEIILNKEIITALLMIVEKHDINKKEEGL